MGRRTGQPRPALRGGPPFTDAQLTLALTKEQLIAIAEAGASVVELAEAGSVTSDGDLEAASVVFGHLDTFFTGFGLAEP
ncbi:MAG: alkyl sulfatase C-terminal domain-containing protein [Ilumatobacteraceae bacterium]